MIRPSPRTAFWLSLCVPGLGLFYAGAPLRGTTVGALALIGFFGALDSFDFMDRRPEYAWYGAIATVVLVAAWWGGAWYARAVAARFQAWPALYRHLGRPELWRVVGATRAEITMAIVFAVLLALYAQYPKPPHWLPDVPRYWFLYEAFGALYLVVATQARAAGFFSLTLAFAYLLALPACLESLRSEAARQVHGMRFASRLVAAFIATFAYAIVLSIAEAATGLRQYQLRLAYDFNVVTAAFGALYYALGAGFEVLIQAKSCQALSRRPGARAQRIFQNLADYAKGAQYLPSCALRSTLDAACMTGCGTDPPPSRLACRGSAEATRGGGEGQGTLWDAGLGPGVVSCYEASRARARRNRGAARWCT